MAAGDTVSASIVVASLGRPEMLRRSLQAIAQLIWPRFEIIVVSDDLGLKVASAEGVHKRLLAPAANLAQSRNLGIGAAAGEIIAFIDDDAVPEPMWLAALVAAFETGSTGAATGPVLGRNGISLQSGKELVCADASTVRADAGRPFQPAPGRAPKTVGTNMAFRAHVLRSAGGFDETFAFYLEDADLNMRLAASGVQTAYAPLAVVHHASAASPRRRADRAPRDLGDIGRSLAAFLLRYAPDDAGRIIDAERQRQRTRLGRYLEAGLLEPRDIPCLLTSFDHGVTAGFEMPSPRLAVFVDTPEFSPAAPPPERHSVITAMASNRRAARAEARRQRNNGAIVSLFVFSRSTLFHRVRFEDGLWIQTGGTWGRSVRTQSLLRLIPAKLRFQEEIARVAEVRGFGSVQGSVLQSFQGTKTDWFQFH